MSWMSKLKFYNSRQKNMSLPDVMNYIVKYIENDPQNVFHFAVTTDSQVIGRKTVYVIAIHVHKKGKGSWACMCKIILNRKILNLRKKIWREMFYTRSLSNFFDNAITTKIYEILLPHVDKGADFYPEAHVDIGKKGDTKQFIKEMSKYFSGTGVKPLIKPEAWAIKLADKHSKTLKIG